MNLHRTFALLLFIALGLQSAWGVEPTKMREWLAYFKTHEPVTEATQNHAKGAVYVIAAMGTGSYYPGISHEQGDEVSKRHAVKWLPGVSDAIEGDLHRQYIDIATAYAQKYNRTTIKLLDMEKKP